MHAPTLQWCAGHNGSQTPSGPPHPRWTVALEGQEQRGMIGDIRHKYIRTLNMHYNIFYYTIYYNAYLMYVV